MLPLGGRLWEGLAGRAALMYKGMGKQEEEPSGTGWGSAVAVLVGYEKWSSSSLQHCPRIDGLSRETKSWVHFHASIKAHAKTRELKCDKVNGQRSRNNGL